AHPSSELIASILPGAVTCDHVSVAGSSTATSWYSLLPIAQRPSARTVAGASPMHCQWFGELVDGGGGSGVQLRATGSKTAPPFESAKSHWLSELEYVYSPPMMATRPSASTAEAKSSGM